MASSAPAISKEDASKGPEWVLARQGIKLLINNEHAEAEAFFLKHPDSLLMYAGYSYVLFMDALMSFEEEKLSKAILVLKEVEKRCTTQTGWLKSISQKVFRSTTTDVDDPRARSLAEELETQIILADSQVCLAILTFLQQDLSGYFKGGWVLRKAWKVYQKTYKEILTLYKDKIGELQLPDPIVTPQSPSSAFNGTNSDSDDEADWDVPEPVFNGYSSKKMSHSRSLNFTQNDNLAESITAQKSINNNTKKLRRPNSLSLKKSISITEALSGRGNRSTMGSARFSISNFTDTLSLTNLTSSLREIFPGQSYTGTQEICKKSIMRLMGAVSFGYGLFQLGISLLPPTYTRIISLLGFTANRQNGVACLMYARLGVDMRAPLASLALLWYHTIVRPFYAIDGVNVDAGVEAANVLIQESQKEFSNSALFLFFGGRASRLNSDVPMALTSFQKAKDNSNHREIKMLCLHEIGWCHLIQLDYAKASGSFNYLKQASRWSRSFYVYLAAICIGSASLDDYSIFDDLQKSCERSRTNQMEEFLQRRIHCSPKNAQDAKNYLPVYFKVLVFEMLYLWNALASCNTKGIDEIIEDCTAYTKSSNVEPRLGLTLLILGSCHSIKNNSREAAECFRKCLESRAHALNNAEDAHISAFAQYELGNILAQSLETKEEGKHLLEQMSKYSHYDFEARLNVRVHSVLRNIE
ncbi:unnamed protein product [Ceutorhynchus assimilis]|uniref:Tetratricopeptide repeat protein 39C n=1 Tax=Ceutorhynchus assimilis TaxID=467358 RepID=A0A9N9QT73_9CUCU|nr:unnamed protein product [Ceutorhynchus assimilis]